MAFVKAQRKRSKLRLALSGPSGSGKTYSALLLAKGLGGKIAVVDTENGSASLYTNLVDFDVMELREPYSPENYMAAIDDAEKAGYNVLLMDSITPEWSGIGGILQLNQQIADAKFRGNTWSAWSETDPRHRRFVDKINQCGMDVIVTMRSKTETAQEKDSHTGRTKVVQLGMKAEQRDNIIYEFTTVLDLIHEKHYATATKDRTGLFMGADPQVISEKTGQKIREWLNSGVEVVPEEVKPDLKSWAKSFAKELKETEDEGQITYLMSYDRENVELLSLNEPSYYARIMQIIMDKKAEFNKPPNDINHDLNTLAKIVDNEFEQALAIPPALKRSK